MEVWFSLFLPASEPAHLVLARQAERDHRAVRLVREERHVAGRTEEYIPRPHVDPAARDGRPRPDRAKVDLLEALTARGIENDQLLANRRREVDDAVGDRDAG